MRISFIWHYKKDVYLYNEKKNKYCYSNCLFCTFRFDVIQHTISRLVNQIRYSYPKSLSLNFPFESLRWYTFQIKSTNEPDIYEYPNTCNVKLKCRSRRLHYDTNLRLWTLCLAEQILNQYDSSSNNVKQGYQNYKTFVINTVELQWLNTTLSQTKLRLWMLCEYDILETLNDRFNKKKVGYIRLSPMGLQHSAKYRTRHQLAP